MRNIINKWITACLLLVITLSGSCKKDENGEEQLLITINADDNEVIPDPTFLLTIEIKSVMPQEGVKIEVSLKGESDQVSYQQINVLKTKKTNNSLLVKDFPRQKYCICIITVTSVSDATNVATASFRIASK